MRRSTRPLGAFWSGATSHCPPSLRFCQRPRPLPLTHTLPSKPGILCHAAVTRSTHGSSHRSQPVSTQTVPSPQQSSPRSEPPKKARQELASLTDADIVRLAKEPLHPLFLADLVKHGWPPLSKEALLQSANFALSRIPVRLARRLQALRNLPYIVVSNQHVRQIYGNYRHSLETLLPWSRRRAEQEQAVATLEEEIAFTDVLAELVATHQNTIPILAQGFLECRKYIAPADVTAFLDEHLRARIGTRLIAEQHIALHLGSRPFGAGDGDGVPAEAGSGRQSERASSSSPPSASPSSYIGIIDTQLKPARTVDSCAEFVADICELKYGVRPHWHINGEPGTTFTYVPMHLEYIVTELLKNAFRAVVENKMQHEPVIITIAPEQPAQRPAPSPWQPPHPASKAAMLPLDDNAPGVTIRIRDRGGGISPKVLPNIWSYSFTTFSDMNDDDDSITGNSSDGSGGGGGGGSDGLSILSSTNHNGSSIAGLGYGLPLGRAYAEFFGGGIAVQSLYGWGTDVYLRLKGIGSIPSEAAHGWPQGRT